MYTTGQVTKYLNVSRPTLYKLCKEKGIRLKKTAGGNYRFSEEDLQKLIDEEKVDARGVEEKFVDTVNDVWLVLKKLAIEIWGIEDGERKLVEVLKKNKKDIFLLNVTNL